MFDLNDIQAKLLRRIGNTVDGKSLIKLLQEICVKISDVDDIEGDYGAQVEGRKLVKQAFKTLIEGIESRQQQGNPQDDDDDYT